MTRPRENCGPSAYIPVTQLPGPSLNDNIAAVMSLHPGYLRVFWKTQHELLRMDGALSLPERHYVAIMVSQKKYSCILKWNKFLALKDV